ncbi:MAG: hypothetical protein JKY54_13830, partial [Flavobacteriales bacterium]|nr:hypothetical protein [Flavobacteriales bacterium]
VKTEEIIQVVCTNVSDNDYRYGFNGMEIDDEVKDGVGNHYDFGARCYDARLGRWLSKDPMSSNYPSISPYAYAINMPISVLDPDGRLIIFVNGFARGPFKLVPLIVGAPKPKGEYFRRPVVNRAKKYFNDDNVSFANGSGRTSLSTAGMRLRRGKRFAKRQLKRALAGKESIFNGEDGKPIVQMQNDGTLKWTETIKVVSHSHGGAFGAGIIEYAMDNGAEVTEVINVAPHGKFIAPADPNTIQVNTEKDPVSIRSGKGEAEEGTDVNITRNAIDYNDTPDKFGLRHYAPLGFMKDGNDKNGGNVNNMFDVIEEETGKKPTQKNDKNN